MELDELKGLWQQYDNSLQKNNILNEKIISTMLNEKSKNALQRMLVWEYIGVSVCAALLLLGTGMGTNIGHGHIAASYFVSMATILFSLVYGVYKINYLLSVKPGLTPVTVTAQKTERFRLLIARERLWTVILSPFLITPILVVALYWVHHIDLLDYLSFYLPRLIMGVIILIGGCLMYYKKIYFHNLEEISANMKEIERFRNS